MSMVMDARTNRIVEFMRAKTKELTEPVRLFEEEQAKKNADVLFSARPAYMILAMRVPMRGTRFIFNLGHGILQ